MRFILILFTLLLLPVMVAVQAWSFARQQQPELQAAALAVLQQAGIQNSGVDLQYLDLRVAGAAPNLQALERATAALQALPPMRLVGNGLSILGSAEADLQGNTLRLAGWVPDRVGAESLTAQLKKLRPDLKVDDSNLHTSAHVRWSQGAKDPFSKEGPLAKSLLAKLRVEPSLQITVSGASLRLSGALPNEEAKDAITKALHEVAQDLQVDTSALLVSPHVLPAPFAAAGGLDAFLRSFYSLPHPGTFNINSKAGARLQAEATPTLEREWTRLLQQVMRGAPVDMQLTRYPSIYHLPGYRPSTQLTKENLESLKQRVSDFYVVFEPGSAVLPEAAKTRLAGLASTLLAAGPALHLVIGGHQDPTGDSVAEMRMALERAEQVRSLLIEQGAPASEMLVTAFDPVPTGSPGAPLQGRSVEILIK